MPRSLTAYVSGITRNHALNVLRAKTNAKHGGKQYHAALDELSPYLKSDEDLEGQAWHDRLTGSDQQVSGDAAGS